MANKKKSPAKAVKIIFFDIDGILIRVPYFFSRVLEKEGYRDAVKILDEFYETKIYHQCLRGKARIERLIPPYLKRIGWRASAEKYFSREYRFETRYLDRQYLSLIRRFRKRGIACVLATDQEKNRRDFLLNKLGFAKYFDDCCVSCDIGYRKRYRGFWTAALKKIKKRFGKVRPDEIAYFDDVEKNARRAGQFGIRAYVYKDDKKFKGSLRELGLIPKK